MKYIKGLDTLRAFAVIIVIIFHWGPNQFKPGLFNFFYTKLKPDGSFGVDLFFVLSGYLITKILLNARESAPENEKLQIIKSFYMRRILRIFPIYFLLIFIVAYGLSEEFVKANIGYYLTYTSNFLDFNHRSWEGLYHTWSLAIEEQFYLFWPWIIIFSPKKYLPGIILSSIGIGIFSNLAIYYLYGKFFLVLLPPCLTAFGIGALLAYVQVNQKFEKIAIRTFQFALPLCIILFFFYQFGHQFILSRAVNSVISISLINYVTRERYNRVTAFIFNNRILSGIGKISYGLYLYHLLLPNYYLQLVQYLQTKITINGRLLIRLTVPPSSYLIYLSLLFLIAILSYNFIEIPFLKLKRYFNYSTQKKHAIAIQS
jgi:peptidoglycan/LPS O-acetylase OafA/YrhL